MSRLSHKTALRRAARNGSATHAVRSAVLRKEKRMDGAAASAIPVPQSWPQQIGGGISIVRELVTPDRAKQMLLNVRDKNRSLKENSVQIYAEAMRRGDWQFNGDPIRFGADGKLFDGQHRLTAIIRSGKPQQ